ncbi:MAG TPA: 3-dehydro-L-gulonate 2-dehydrogenase [Bacteroidales bacterium]|nr:3-dehydro-L-gulonate 2-dehydrogenase [Bacteroidales bacterium]
MANVEKIIRISSDQMNAEFLRILIKRGFTEARAGKCAEIFTLNSLEGVYSHGVNRFPRFVKNIIEGYIKPDEVPSLVHKTGALEQWNGNLGPGPLNAMFATERVTELAQENGIGMVAMANTNHWMRAGTYGWKAARKDFVFISWTNTCPNLPAWGAKDPRLGNNPLVFAVPYNGDAIVLDFAMSQFSYGKMESFNEEGKKLPYPGGFNNKGQLTTDPGEILETWRPLPIGYWKGASLALLLDIMATVLSGGLSTHQISSCVSENSLSQVFIAIHIKSLHNFPAIDNSIKEIIEDLKKSIPENETARIRYPGENMTQIREENLKDGIPVNKDIWDKILRL